MKVNELEKNKTYTLTDCSSNNRIAELGICNTPIKLIQIIFNWMYIFTVRGTLIAIRKSDVEDLVFIEVE